MKFIVKIDYNQTHIIHTIHCNPTDELIAEVIRGILDQTAKLRILGKKVENAKS